MDYPPSNEFEQVLSHATWKTLHDSITLHLRVAAKAGDLMKALVEGDPRALDKVVDVTTNQPAEKLDVDYLVGRLHDLQSLNLSYAKVDRDADSDLDRGATL